MELTFGELYEGLMQLEQGLVQLENDYLNASCDYATKCILEEELFRIRVKVESLYDTDIDFTSLNFERLIDQINDCMGCIELIIKEEE